jgi:Gas vesicle synthesis protein GvpL/GvpF
VTPVLTYVYCLVRAARRPSLRGVPDGMPGSEGVRLLAISGTPSRRGGQRDWLVVSSVPDAMYGEDALQHRLQDLEWIGPRALAHEAVIEHFLSFDAVLPMQLFALFKSDARAVEHIVRNNRRIGRILLRIERQVEWGLRLIWDPRALEMAQQPRLPRATSVQARRVVSGADYLVRKRNQRDQSRVLLQRARADASRLYRTIAGEASEARRRSDVERTAPGSRLLLDAAFLVPARRTRAFQAVVRRHTGPLERAGISVSLTGPWPPYNFI